MDKELKSQLKEFKDAIAEIKKDMATKDDLKSLATKDDLKKTEGRLTKKIDEVLDYAKFLDEELSAHRRNSEVHHKVSA
ncbi:MAG: hypothetical protein KKH83_00610 [Candidatus Margulisbacteria bacterium]|nr:hypothetical protein [Candidatus Margulisiibacteriota bacterium]